MRKDGIAQAGVRKTGNHRNLNSAHDLSAIHAEDCEAQNAIALPSENRMRPACLEDQRYLVRLERPCNRRDRGEHRGVLPNSGPACGYRVRTTGDGRRSIPARSHHVSRSDE